MALFPEALRQEMALTAGYLEGRPVESIYVGGGTPSLFSPKEIPLPDPALFPITGKGNAPPEITLEVNPEDVTETFVIELAETPFNRISLGVQSFIAEELRYLQRHHSAGQSLHAIRLLKEAGFHNLSIDLIFGLPGSDEASLRMNLEKTFSLEIPHFSGYALTVEERTPLAWLIRKHRKLPPEDDIQAGQFMLLMKLAREYGYEQYEISNFALDGRYARHNSGYWQGTPYLGLGPSAHSYNGWSRRWNVSGVTDYLEAMKKGKPLFEEEILSTTQQYNEYVMTSLRTRWGCSMQKIGKDFGPAFQDFITRRMNVYVRNGWMEEKNGCLYLTDEGKLRADGIAAALFMDDGKS